MGILANLGKNISKGLDYLSAPLAKPYITLTRGITAGAKAVEQQRQTGLTIGQGLKQIAVIGGTAGAVGAAVLAAAPASATGAAGVAARTGLTSTAKFVAPKTAKGAIVAGVAAPIVYGAVKREPEKVKELVNAAPSNLAQFGGNVAGFAANPSLSSAKKVVEENPLIAGGVALAIGGGLIKTAIPALTTHEQTEAIKEQTKAIQRNTETPTPTGDIKVTPIQPETPQLPRTQEITKTAPKARKSIKRKGVNISQVNQKVNVIVSNKANSVGIKTTKYLNKAILN